MTSSANFTIGDTVRVKFVIGAQHPMNVGRVGKLIRINKEGNCGYVVLEGNESWKIFHLKQLEKHNAQVETPGHYGC